MLSQRRAPPPRASGTTGTTQSARSTCWLQRAREAASSSSRTDWTRRSQDTVLSDRPLQQRWDQTELRRLMTVSAITTLRACCIDALMALNCCCRR